MSDRITSVHNPRVRQAIKLRDRDGRDAHQQFLIDGAREIGRALDGGVEIVELFVCNESLRPEAHSLVDRARQRGARIWVVAPVVQSRLTFGDRDEGLVATARLPEQTLAGLTPAEDSVVAVLAGVEKPGNVGAVIRSADAAGVAALIVADGGTDRYNPNAIRASLGTIFALPVIAATSLETLAWLRQHAFRIFATRTRDAPTYTGMSYTGRVAFVLGNEATGLNDSWSGRDIVPISLPMLGMADSLNVSVTGGILFYEALRQRSEAGYIGGRISSSSTAGTPSQ
jgi:TrmH family RNA methyltransferase